MNFMAKKMSYREFIDAIEGGDLTSVMEIYEKKHEWSTEDLSICEYATENGHLHVLQWLVENGFPWDERICEYAAYNGRLDILQWARENGCPWNTWVCSYAAQNGYLDILQWGKGERMSMG
jgi:hypothetical protein